MTGLNFQNIILTHNVSTSQSSSGVYIVVTMVVIGLGERNAQADNGRAEMVCNDKWRKNKIKQKLQKPQKNKRDNNTNAKRNVENTKAKYKKGRLYNKKENGHNQMKMKSTKSAEPSAMLASFPGFRAISSSMTFDPARKKSGGWGQRSYTYLLHGRRESLGTSLGDVSCAYTTNTHALTQEIRMRYRTQLPASRKQ